MKNLVASKLVSDTRRIYLNDPLLLALNMFAGIRKHSPYRLPLVDRGLKVRGVISARRILEIILERRGKALRRKGIAELLRQDVSLFCDELHNVFPETTSAEIIAQYMAESSLGFVCVVDKNSIFKGIINETPFIEKMRKRSFNIKVSEVMHGKAFTISSEADILSAAKIMMEKRVRRLVVLDDKKIKGILAIKDVLHDILLDENHIDAILSNIEVTNFLRKPLRTIMISNVAQIGLDDDIGIAANEMVEKDVSSLVVTSADGSLEGIVSRIDFLVGLNKIEGMQALSLLID